MEEFKRFHVFMERNYFPNDSFELYVIGIIQGLLYGMCAIPCNTTMWDCERFNNFVLFPVDCTSGHAEEFLKIVDLKWPGLCHIDEV